MSKVLEKVERRLGEKLFLKGDRCVGPKCAMVRRAYPPGVHGKSRKRGKSEYGELLHEKQVIRFMYGLDDKDIERYSREAVSQAGVFNSNFIRMLEERLDNAVFRLGFAGSRRIARQLVGHGHIIVNSRSVDIPSFRVKNGDAVSIKEKALSFPLFSDLDTRLKKYDPPAWLSLDKNKKSGNILRAPEADEAGLKIDVTKIKEFYSR